MEKAGVTVVFYIGAPLKRFLSRKMSTMLGTVGDLGITFNI